MATKTKSKKATGKERTFVVAVGKHKMKDGKGGYKMVKRGARVKSREDLTKKYPNKFVLEGHPLPSRKRWSIDSMGQTKEDRDNQEEEIENEDVEVEDEESSEAEQEEVQEEKPSKKTKKSKDKKRRWTEEEENDD